MSGAIRELRDYLAKSPSVIYPEDVLAYLPAIETENAKLRQELAIRNVSEQEKVIEYLRQESIGWEDKYRALASENAKLRELASLMYRDMQGVLDMSTDTVWVDDIGTLRDEMDCHMQTMAELGMPPADYEQRMRDLGVDE